MSEIDSDFEEEDKDFVGVSVSCCLVQFSRMWILKKINFLRDTLAKDQKMESAMD